MLAQLSDWGEERRVLAQHWYWPAPAPASLRILKCSPSSLPRFNCSKTCRAIQNFTVGSRYRNQPCPGLLSWADLRWPNIADTRLQLGQTINTNTAHCPEHQITENGRRNSPAVIFTLSNSWYQWSSRNSVTLAASKLKQETKRNKTIRKSDTPCQEYSQQTDNLQLLCNNHSQLTNRQTIVEKKTIKYLIENDFLGE